MMGTFRPTQLDHSKSFSVLSRFAHYLSYRCDCMSHLWSLTALDSNKPGFDSQARHHIRDVSKTLIAGWKTAHTKDSNAEAPAKQSGKHSTPGLDASAIKISDRSFLNALLAARGTALAVAPGKEVRQLDDAEVVQQALTFILAGWVFFDSWDCKKTLCCTLLRFTCFVCFELPIYLVCTLCADWGAMFTPLLVHSILGAWHDVLDLGFDFLFDRCASVNQFVLCQQWSSVRCVDCYIPCFVTYHVIKSKLQTLLQCMLSVIDHGYLCLATVSQILILFSMHTKGFLSEIIQA